MRLSKARVHFIGIGGIGMCGLAELLHNMGASVTGSDPARNMQTRRLEEIGVKVSHGHAAENLGDCEVVVYSSAIRDTNVEFREARRRKIPLIRRAEALAEMMHLKRGVAIAGSHGKTTTTSLTASVFLGASMDPTIIVGGRLEVIKSTAQLGRGEWLIAEADESDGSFTHLSPEIVVITNIDNDHLDHYGSFDRLQAAFLDFAMRIPFYGVAIVCGDDPRLRVLFENFGKRWISYGVGADNDYVLRKENSGAWQIFFEGQKVADLRPPMPGDHNALNCLASMVVGYQAGIPLAVGARLVSEFSGVDRRFQHKASVRGIEFYDDYGHHPTEIRAVLSAFKEKFPERRLVTVFQPHRYTRTQICWNEFHTCFNQSDVVFLLDIYPAGEVPLPGISSEELISGMQHPACRYLSREADPALSEVLGFIRPGDILLTLGAGDISRLGEQMVISLSAFEKNL